MNKSPRLPIIIRTWSDKLCCNTQQARPCHRKPRPRGRKAGLSGVKVPPDNAWVQPDSRKVRLCPSEVRPMSLKIYLSSCGVLPMTPKMLPGGEIVRPAGRGKLPGGQKTRPASPKVLPDARFVVPSSHGELPDGSILSPATSMTHPANHGEHLGRQVLLVETPWRQSLGAVFTLVVFGGIERAFVAHHGKTRAAGCRAVVPQGRPKIAQRLIAGPGVGRQKSPKGTKEPPVGPGRREGMISVVPAGLDPLVLPTQR